MAPIGRYIVSQRRLQGRPWMNRGSQRACFAYAWQLRRAD
jgi:hypothetical protein